MFGHHGDAAMSEMALPTGTLTFLLTDVEGSTALWEADSDSMSKALARHRELIADAAARHHGARPVEQGEGDSTVSVFARPSDALAAAVEAQASICSDTGLKVRMALNTG